MNSPEKLAPDGAVVSATGTEGVPATGSLIPDPVGREGAGVGECPWGPHRTREERGGFPEEWGRREVPFFEGISGRGSIRDNTSSPADAAFFLREWATALERSP